MTKMIKVTCPSCKKALSLPEQQLRDTDGRTDCSHCGHSFRLIKKKKAENQPTPAPQKDIFADVGTKDPIFPTDGFPTGEKTIAQPKKAQPKLNYREPKAESKKPKLFAETEQKPMAFNLLDTDTANSQIPQVSIKPAVNNAPALATGTPDQQNNITIHTDSLVFTLVGDNTNDSSNIVNNTPNKTNAPIMVASSNDLNWTIAVFCMIIILMLQLFYLVLIWY